MEKVIQNLDLGAKGIWLPFLVAGVALLYILLMPKRQLNWLGIYLTFGVVGYVACVMDLFIVVEHLDVIDLGSKTKDGLGDLITYGVIPSCFAVIFLNYFTWKNRWFLIVLFTAISFFFEWSLTQIGYMKLNGWQNWYSIPVYLLVYGYWLPWHLKIIQRTFARVAEQPRQDTGAGCYGLNNQPAMKPLATKTDIDKNKLE